MSANRTAPVSNLYRNYVLYMLMIVYAFNFIDRQILTILQEPIKAELGLSDTQLGLMTGLAFALFYVVMGLPIARWADRGNRRNIMAGSLAVWSLMTALSGFAQNYFQLLLARIGVGIGEAGGSPPAHAMLSDYFPPEKRATAISIYSAGLYLGLMIGFLLGGWMADTLGWRIAFFVVGLPGVLLAVIIRATIKEPKRGAYDSGTAAPVPLKAVMAHFNASKAMKLTALGCGLASFVGYSNLNFIPSLMIRVYGMSLTEVGIYLSLAIGLGGGLGTYASGFLADKLGKKDPRWRLWITSFNYAIIYPLGFYVLMSEHMMSIWYLGLFFFLGSMYLGPSIAVCHSLSKPAMRALVSAILFFVLNLIGLGLGPLVTGMLSDMFAAQYGAQSIQQALLWVHGVGNLCVITVFFFAGRALGDESKKTEGEPSV